MGFKISVSSLRLDQIEDELLDVLVESGDQQIAVAPETGSDRLRKVINKNLTNDEIVDICGAVFDRGMLTVKLYLMAGLPTETDEDLEEMVVLVERIKDRMLEAGRRFGRAGKIIPALNGFVPKPNTPFQWEPICEERELKRRLKWLSKNLARIPNVEVRVMSARIAHEQALFSSGDRSAARVIEAMTRHRGDLDAALRETGVDIGFPHAARAPLRGGAAVGDRGRGAGARVHGEGTRARADRALDGAVPLGRYVHALRRLPDDVARRRARGAGAA